MDDLFIIEKVTYWHGHGTLTRPHTDAMENMMCVYEGYKNFTIVAPMDLYMREQKDILTITVLLNLLI